MMYNNMKYIWRESRRDQNLSNKNLLRKSKEKQK